MPVVAGGSPDVFIINDINLLIPPTSIDVRKEDLTYEWRTLRTSTATKIASGHGQVAVRVEIAFTQDLMLDMHRLIVQFRQSPFCYIDNRYLRQVLVPDWPINQNMAFTMTSLQVYPMRGSSDTWVMELDLVWFNYLPFTPNYIFREDWNTEWVRASRVEGVEATLTDRQVSKGAVKYTIGWDYDPVTNKRTPRKSVVDVNEAAEGGVARWDQVYQAYSTKKNRTIWDMEIIHEGQIFDLLPMPGNMEPSRFVFMPEQSRVYKRYINYLQRDALLRNFDIDVEADLRSYGSLRLSNGVELSGQALVNYFFAAVKTDGVLRTGMLHREAPAALRSKWIGQMVEYHKRVTFVYDVYKDIRLPNEWTQKLNQERQTMIERVLGQSPGVVGQEKVIGGRTVRLGYSFPEGKHIPVWNDIESFVTNINQAQRVKMRAGSERDAVYGVASGTNATSMHEGLDILTRISSGGPHAALPVYAVEDGWITVVSTTTKWSLDMWFVVDNSANANKAHKLKVRDQGNELFDELMRTLKAEGLVDDNNDPTHLDDWGGVVVRSIDDPSRIFFHDTGRGGNYIEINHYDCSAHTPSISKYLHLSAVAKTVETIDGQAAPLKRGVSVKKGTVIGWTGATSEMDGQYIDWAAKNQNKFLKLSENGFVIDSNAPTTWVGQGSDARILDPYMPNPHLHFEYYEPKVVEKPGSYSDPAKSTAGSQASLSKGVVPGEGLGKAPKAVYESQATHVLVDVGYSYEEAEKVDPYSKVISMPEQNTELLAVAESVTQDMVDKGEISLEERGALLDLFDALYSDGWRYYEADTNVQNVWYKRPIHTVYRSKYEGSPAYEAMLTGKQAGDAMAATFVHDDIVLTGVSGGLTHIVAHLPLLSHEFPTQQHLGSIEPSYVLEFAVLDDFSTYGLDGIGFNGELIQAMRSRLQANARQFRTVTDGWCLVTDTFVTRLLGTTSTYDYIGENKELGTEEEVQKRTVIASDATSTVKGQPGLSTMVLRVQETNPYQEDKIVSTAPKLTEIEDARAKILAALYKMDFLGGLREEHLPFLIGGLAGFDKEGRAVIPTDITKLTNSNVVFDRRTKGGPSSLLFVDNDGTYQALLRKFIDSGQIRVLQYGEDPRSNVVNSDVIEVPVDFIEQITGTEVTDNFGTTLAHQMGATAVLDLEEYADQLGIDFNALSEAIAYHKELVKVLQTAELILFEEELGGFSRSYLSGQLYKLNIQNNGWHAFQEYLNTYIKQAGKGWVYGDWSNALEENENYLNSGDELIYGLSPEGQAVVREMGAGWYNQSPLWSLYEAVENSTEYAVASTRSALPHYNMADFQMAKIERARRAFANNYISNLPLAIRGSSFVEENFKYVVGDLLGSQKPAAFMNLQEDYMVYLASNNLLTWGALAGSGNAVNFPGAGLTKNENGVWGIEGTVVESVSVRDQLLPYGYTPTGNAALDAAALFSMLGDDGKEQLGNPVNSPSHHPVDRQSESAKVRYLKQVLAAIADQARLNPSLLELFELQDLAFIDTGNDYKGHECYPDLVLPFHPYYGDLYQTSPDFYMWNLYEDGGAFSRTMQEEVEVGLGNVITNCYNSLKGFEGEVTYNAGQEPLIEDTSVDDTVGSRIRYAAEGTDKGVTKTEAGLKETGPMGSPFAQSEEGENWEKKFYQSWQFKDMNSAVQSTKPPHANGTGLDEAGQKVGITTEAYNLKLGTTDGSYQYPFRVGLDTYQELWEKVNSTEKMFGSRSGYLGEDITDENLKGLKTRLSDTAAAALDEYVHGFSPDFLKGLARDSSKDMVSQKMTMRRAYPTFKLLFVEEDEFESRFLNFDDFHSYNAVKEFSVVQSRKMAADFAVITLQNVAGTLDGTARGVVTDLDYFSRKRTKVIGKTDPTAGLLAEEAVEAGTAADQPFGALVLRPGVNIQLRAGYSNDPDALEVLISGRVVDVAWNQGGDLVEIHVQSFGAELEQVLKGSHPAEAAYEQYATTHQLLGTMMLSPELAHFGRWEFGQLYQIGESKDSRLDFHDYSREGFLGRFKATSWTTKWIVNHPYIMLGLALGGSALQFLPIGKGSGMLGKFLTRIGVGAKAVAPIEKSVIRETLDLALRSTDNIVDDAAKALARRERIRAVVKNSFARYYDDAIKMGAAEADETFSAIFKGLDPVLEGFEAGINSADDVAAAVIRTQRHVQAKVFAGNWLGVAVFSPISLSWLGSAGKTVGGRAFNTLLSGGLKLGTTITVGALAADAFNNYMLRPLYDATVLNVRKFFTRTQTSLFVSPQDDNLYPPSPKDYMVLEKPGWVQSFSALSTRIAGRLVFASDEFGNLTHRWLNPNLVFEKRVHPQQCLYTPIYTTIWEIFHEMSLRHPGWVYGSRPYGRDFRYTMFFGVPSQRYWSKPAPNRFIYRMNQLKMALENGTVQESEYRRLYGDSLETGQEIDEWKEAVYRQVDLEMGDTNVIGLETSDPGYEQYQESDNSSAQPIIEQTFTARALKEYLRGLELRFIPWRRYHLFTSHRDIIWNGITSSESSVINAVDVAYYDDGYSVGSEQSQTNMPQGTELIKASSQIPEHQLRIKAVQWPNCRGYTMALRYGMGELMHSMRDMYRGEFLVVGNARVKPWDVAIVVDTYNDMVGPIEVEQVVHNFSHETGYVTEIKPSAIVIGNEISSWPVIEAMKLFSMAVQDIERNYGGVGSSSGFIGDTANWADWMQHNIGLARGGLTGETNHEFDTMMAKKYRDIFGEGGANMSRDGFGGAELPSHPAVDALQTDLNTFLEDANYGVAGAGVLASGSLFTMGTVVPVKGLMGAFSKKAAFGVGATALVGSGVLAYGSYKLLTRDSHDAPSLAWLIGGPIIMSKIMKEDAIMIVPLIKNGNPIISGLSYHDPSMIWNHFKGKLNNYANDAVLGVRDAAQLYQDYGTTIWRKIGEPTFGEVVSGALSGRDMVTGEEG